MNYDQTDMPAAYDAGRGYSPSVLAYWLEVIAQSVPRGSVSEILDLGCGTGRYSNALADFYDANVIAIDPSEKMLAEARRKASSRVRCERASAESLPLPNASVDMAFISMAFHHFDHPDRAAAECRRVLRPNGSVCLRAGTIDRIDSYAYVDFFPGSRPILHRVLQSQVSSNQLSPAPASSSSATNLFRAKPLKTGLRMRKSSPIARTRFSCSFPIANSTRDWLLSANMRRRRRRTRRWLSLWTSSSFVPFEFSLRCSEAEPARAFSHRSAPGPLHQDSRRSRFSRNPVARTVAASGGSTGWSR